MFLRHLFLFTFSIPSATPLPLQETEPPYVPQPSGRGTIGLLWSCTLTLILCIWTAIHPDVFAAKSSWYRTLYKAYWTTFSAIFPEFLVCCAIAQYMQARKLHKAWIKAWGDRQEKDWLGMPGAFFVVMGGYVVTEGTRNLQQKEIATENQGDMATPADQSPTTEGATPLLEPASAAKTAMAQQAVWNLTAAGMEQLLKTRDEARGSLLRELIDKQILTRAHFDHTAIEDKGKANNIAKLLVSLQILWVVAQCIGRKVQGLPLTLLEIHILTRMPPRPFVHFHHHLTTLQPRNPLHNPGISLLVVKAPRCCRSHLLADSPPLARRVSRRHGRIFHLVFPGTVAPSRCWGLWLQPQCLRPSGNRLWLSPYSGG